MKKNGKSKKIDLVALFPENLFAARDRADLTQAQLAARAGVTTSHVSMLERGERVPSLEMIQILAEAMGMDPRLFFRGTR